MRTVSLLGRVSICAMALTITAAAAGNALASPLEVQSGGAEDATVIIDSEMPAAPRVDHVRLRASALRSGMAVSEVERIMGSVGKVETAAVEEIGIRVLSYATEPIATKVTFLDGRVTGVAVNVAGFDASALPPFSQAVWQGMSRPAVLRLLGQPSEEHQRELFGTTLDQLIFARRGEPDVGVYLMADRVVAVKVLGRALPTDIFHLVLPAAPGSDPDGGGAATVRIGMTLEQMQASGDAPDLRVVSSFKGQPVEYAIYRTGGGSSFTRVVFVGGVLTEFSDLGQSSLERVVEGR